MTSGNLKILNKKLYKIEAIYKDEYGKEVKLISGIRYDKKFTNENDT